MTGSDLRDEFGGKWDGGGREIHGLINVDGRDLKIELLRASDWVCSVFLDGTCIVSTRKTDAVTAVREALETLAA